MPYKYNKLRGRIIEKYGSQSKFADALGVSKQQVSNTIRGNAGFTQAKIIRWSDALEIDHKDVGRYFFV